MRPAAAFAEMTNEVQQPAIEEAVKTGDAATIEEAPAEDATEEQPEEDVIQPEEPSSDAVETPSDETVANEGESTGDGTESAAETVDGTEATTPTEGADPPFELPRNGRILVNVATPLIGKGAYDGLRI